jgi:hypothetical protein
VRRILGDGWWLLGSEQLVGRAEWTKTVRSRELGSGPLSYTDISAGWRHDTRAVSLGASAGLRFQPSGGPNVDSRQLLDAAAWFTPNAALVLTLGRTLEDYVRGTPRTTWIGASIRISATRHVSVRRAPADRTAPRLTVMRIDAHLVVLEISVPNAGRVELMADFTDWQPVALERVGNAWRLERAITPGLHRISVRTDEGAWVAPSNLPRADASEAGVGLLTVP